MAKPPAPVPPGPQAARKADWPDRLHRFVDGHRRKPYAWGGHDCVLFAANAVKELTGKDHGRGHRGKYKNKLGAYRYLKEIGFDSIEALIDSKLPQKPVGFAQRGDIVMTADGIPALCMGAFALGPHTETGLVRIPRKEWVKAWGVGA